MIWLLIVIAVLLALILWELGAAVRAIRGATIAASDLNLEAHARLLDHFKKLEREKSRDRHDAFMRDR